jgi:hypothetical protein
MTFVYSEVIWWLLWCWLSVGTCVIWYYCQWWSGIFCCRCKTALGRMWGLGLGGGVRCARPVSISSVVYPHFYLYWDSTASVQTASGATMSWSVQTYLLSFGWDSYTKQKLLLAWSNPGTQCITEATGGGRTFWHEQNLLIYLLGWLESHWSEYSNIFIYHLLPYSLWKFMLMTRLNWPFMV